MAVVTDEAVAAGVGSMPTPITEMASDLWFLYQVWMAAESNLTDRSRSGNVYSLDSKAMRRVDIGEDIVVIQELSATGGGALVTTGGRMLVKLH